MRFDLVGVPWTSGPIGIARAIEVLRAAGLAGRLQAAGDVRDAGDLRVRAGDGERGPSGLLHEAALGGLVAATRDAVAASHARGRIPLLVGGDCPVMLGALAAMRDRHGGCGLLLVDGHEDAWPPALSETGEASDSEVGIALGLIPAPLPGLPLLSPAQVAMLGPRDRAEIASAGVESLAGVVALFLDDAAVRDAGPPAAARRAADAIEAAAFWLHVDLDVLRTDELAAVDYPQSGGLSWDELLGLTAEALREPRCAGLSVVIYNPDLDPTGAGAQRIAALLERLVD